MRICFGMYWQAWIGAIHRAVGVSSLMREPVSSTTRGAATIRLLFPTAYRADTVLQTVSTCLRNWVVPRLSRTSMVMVLPTNSGILVGLTAGISFTIGKVGWRKVIDPVPYIRQNEELAVHALCLAGKNRGLQKNNAMNLAIIAELKKILELEGLLDRYADKLSELVGNAESQTASSGYPRNNYSGLNSLRARLNQSPLTEASDSTSSAHPAAHTNEQIVSQRQHTHHLDSDASQLVSDSLYIGAPIYFFFVLNTGHLTDTSQLINLDGIARIANKHGLHIRVSGAADNATGNETLNNSLGLCRAEYIKAQLIKRAVPSNRIEIVSEGGIDDYSPNEANRNACVRLLAPPK